MTDQNSPFQMPNYANYEVTHAFMTGLGYKKNSDQEVF